MNESLPVDYNEFFPDINFSGLTRPTIFILLGCMSIVFPFYVYVYKTNRPKEEKVRSEIKYLFFIQQISSGITLPNNQLFL